MSTKAPNPVDKYVGSRVRMRRIMLGMLARRLHRARTPPAAHDALLGLEQIDKVEHGHGVGCAVGDVSKLVITRRITGKAISSAAAKSQRQREQ